MNTDQFDQWMSFADGALATYVPKVLMAVVVLAADLCVIRLVMRGVRWAMSLEHVDQTLQRFLSSLIGWGLENLLFVSVIQMLGVATTSFVAIIGAAGRAVGLALQVTLSNFVGGVLILLFRPYKVSDPIVAQGVTGHVKEIRIFTTTLLTPENKLAMVPSGAMANGNIINHTTEGRLRVDLNFGVSGDSSIADVRRILGEVMKAHPNVMADPRAGQNGKQAQPVGHGAGHTALLRAGALLGCVLRRVRARPGSPPQGRSAGAAGRHQRVHQVRVLLAGRRAGARSAFNPLHGGSDHRQQRFPEFVRLVVPNAGHGFQRFRIGGLRTGDVGKQLVGGHDAGA